jgi:hypothetical protein
MRKTVMSAIVMGGLLVSGNAMAAQSLISTPFHSGGSSFTTSHPSLNGTSSQNLMRNPVFLGNPSLNCQPTTLPGEGDRGAPASISKSC